MTFQGSLNELPLPDIIQLVAVSGKTGMFDLTHQGTGGQIFLREGQIVHARTASVEGEEAIYELATWPDGDFVFTPGQEPEVTTINKPNTNLLMEAARRMDEWRVLSKRIPSTRMVPVFCDPRGVNTSVSFTPQEWAIICKIDGRRSIEEIALLLGQSSFETCKHLYGLLTSKLADLQEDLLGPHRDRLSALDPEHARRLADGIHRAASQLLGEEGVEQLSQARQLCAVEIRAGRVGDALLDLLSSHLQTVASGGGPEAKAKLTAGVQRFLREQLS